jgi:hypothetical protein
MNFISGNSFSDEKLHCTEHYSAAHLPATYLMGAA